MVTEGIGEGFGGVRVLDLCSGSGCIGILLLQLLREMGGGGEVRVVGMDISVSVIEREGLLFTPVYIRVCISPKTLEPLPLLMRVVSPHSKMQYRSQMRISNETWMKTTVHRYASSEEMFLD